MWCFVIWNINEIILIRLKENKAGAWINVFSKNRKDPTVTQVSYSSTRITGKNTNKKLNNSMAIFLYPKCVSCSQVMGFWQVISFCGSLRGKLFTEWTCVLQMHSREEIAINVLNLLCLIVKMCSYNPISVCDYLNMQPRGIPEIKKKKKHIFQIFLC